MSEFYLWGGVFQNNSLAWALPQPQPADIEAGTLEVHGPFRTETEARKAQKEFTMRNVDICAHRILVHEVDASEAAAWRMSLATSAGTSAKQA